MKKVKIIADSTCDLSAELMEKYEIKTFPLHIHMGNDEYLDGIDITPDDIYQWSDENKLTPKTSAISPAEAQKYMEEGLKEAEELICFTISEKLSSTCSVMHMTAAMMGVEDRVYIIDSMNLSTGIALQIIEAATMINKGYNASEIVEKIKAIQSKVKSSFVVDTLTYLHRGGRCNAVAAIAGNSLKLHPCIHVEEGKMDVGKFYRGKMNKVLKRYVDDMKPSLEQAKKDRVFITHSGCDREVIDDIEKELLLMGFHEVLITRAGSVITSHCGPGTLGVLYIER